MYSIPKIDSNTNMEISYYNDSDQFSISVTVHCGEMKTYSIPTDRFKKVNNNNTNKKNWNNSSYEHCV